MRKGLWLVAGLGLLMTACVEETDANLPSEGGPVEALPPAGGSEAPAAAVATIAASLTEWNIALSASEVPAGTVSIEVRNNGTMPHALEIEGGAQEWHTEPIAPGEAVTMSVVLPAGTYELYCPLEAEGTTHRQQGMSTTLRVT